MSMHMQLVAFVAQGDVALLGGGWAELLRRLTAALAHGAELMAALEAPQAAPHVDELCGYGNSLVLYLSGDALHNTATNAVTTECTPACDWGAAKSGAVCAT